MQKIIVIPDNLICITYNKEQQKKNFHIKIPFTETYTSLQITMFTNTNFVNENDIIYEEDLEVTCYFIYIIFINKVKYIILKK